jgi:hypothetical protein
MAAANDGKNKLAGIGAAAAILAAALCLAACATGNKGEPKTDAASSASTVSQAGGSVLGELGPAPKAGKTLVVYYTSGNASERVAADLAELYSADIERIIEKKPRKWSFMSGGFMASMGLSVAIETPRNDPSAYDRVFVLTPVWAWRLSPPVRSYLRWAKGRLPEVAYGTISGDTEPAKIVAEMAKAGGRKPFAYAGFSEKDFKAENRSAYLEKLAYLAGIKERPAK